MVIEVQYKCNVTERKKAAVALQVCSKEYSVMMTMTSSMVKATFKRSATTAAELVAEMHKQYRITGHKTGRKRRDETDDDNKIAVA